MNMVMTSLFLGGLAGLQFGRSLFGLAMCWENFPGCVQIKLPELLRQLKGLSHHTLHLVIITHLQKQDQHSLKSKTTEGNRDETSVNRDIKCKKLILLSLFWPKNLHPNADYQSSSRLGSKFSDDLKICAFSEQKSDQLFYHQHFHINLKVIRFSDGENSPLRIQRGGSPS